MGRAWFVAAFLVAVSGIAEAKRVECQCPESLTYPPRDSRDVPTNQRAIALKPWSADEPIEITSLGDLDPDTDYHFDAPYLRFHTGKDSDISVPSAPTSVHPSIVFGPNTATVALWGDYDPDTMFLQIEIQNTNSLEIARLAMRSRNPYLCSYDPRGRMTSGPARIKIWAIDAAGNRSAEPWIGETIIQKDTTDPSGSACTERHHVRCGMGSGLLFLLVVPAGFILLLVVLAIGGLIRRSRIRNTPGEHVSIPLGESVARIVAKAYVIKFFVAVATIAALWQLEHEIVAVILTPLPLLWFFDVLRAQAVVRRFAQPVNRLERREDWLLVDHTLLYCGRRAWNRASRLPSATVPKR